MQALIDRAVSVTNSVTQYGNFSNADYSFEQKKPDFVRGIDACFFRLNDEWGFKFFCYEETRDDSFDIQKELSEHGLAPKVGPRIDTKDSEGCLVYGFLTEIVNVGLKNDDCHKKNDIYPWAEIVEELKENIRALGYQPDDLHLSNIGHTKDGKYVVIDVGYFERIS